MNRVSSIYLCSRDADAKGHAGSEGVPALVEGKMPSFQLVPSKGYGARQ